MDEEITEDGILASEPRDGTKGRQEDNQNCDTDSEIRCALESSLLKGEDSSTSFSFGDQTMDSIPDNVIPSLDILEDDLSKASVSQENDQNEKAVTDSHATSSNFQIDTQAIPCVPREEQDEELLNLGVSVYDQTQFENEVIGQVDKALKEQEEKRRKLEVEKDLKAVTDDMRLVKQRLSQINKALSMAPKDINLASKDGKREISAIKKEQENKLKQLKKLEAKYRTLNACINGDLSEVEMFLKDDIPDSGELDVETRYHLEKVFSSKESEEERMIRTGQMTPFGTFLPGQERNSVRARTIKILDDGLSDFDKFLSEQAQKHESKKSAKLHTQKSGPSPLKSIPSTSKVIPTEPHRPSLVFKARPGDHKPASVPPLIPKLYKTKKKREKIKLGSKHAVGMKVKRNVASSLIENYKSDSDISDFETGDFEMKDDDDFSGSDKDYVPEMNLSEDSEKDHYVPKSKKAKKSAENEEPVQWANFKPVKKVKKDADDECDSDDTYLGKEVSKKRRKKVIDDGCQKAYVKRMKALQKAELIKKHKKIMESSGAAIDSDEESYVEFEGSFKVPSSVWNKLYRYQQTGVRWLWELHQQNCGGIIGDEMGLGKTIQVIAFLVGLKVSKILTDGDNFQGLGPVFLVCPATVMHQWVKEFHTWWPHFRVAVLHESGSYSGPKDLLVRTINKSCGILVTSYAGVVLHQEPLLAYDWHYVILDEGHKIRNPDAQATLVVKQFRTQHRIILSGSPVQNNLKELWSLFDFIFPGKLGTLPVFMQQFSVPIVQGGYANASQVQVQTAYKCATVLRDTIKPYLLRRMKADVKMSIQLPNKSEQVLFCQLTEEQQDLYKDYLSSPEIANIINGRFQIFVGLINLRKICNHPDLYSGGPKIFKHTDISTLTEDMHYGYYKRSGKMIVVEALLQLWHKQGHRVLLFTQSRQMMEILEHFVKTRGYTYMKMDGTTSIASRQPAVAKFNADPSIFVFILTTRVGGLGVNLTGANRIILYDPDWNPSTDAQARERAWRIGQEKQVTIYRLLTAGTIEEKIYHRQIFKQFVTNRVLKDPRQRRFFKSNDLYELFTFTEMGKEGTETSAIFAGTGSEVKPGKHSKSKHDSKVAKYTSSPQKPKARNAFTPEKLEKMKQLARKLSLELSQKKNASGTNTPGGIPEAKDRKEGETAPKSHNVSLESCATNSEINDSVGKIPDPSKNMKGNSSKDRKIGKHKRKSKSGVVEGEKIDFLVKQDVYKPAPEKEEEDTSQQDDYVLSKLFKRSGVHTALKHDKIVESSDPDYLLVEGEANRVAKEAVKALKASRKFCARAQQGIPTWTGLHGGVAQGAKPRFGLKKKNLVSSDPPPVTSSTPNEESIPGPSSALQNKPGIFAKKKADGPGGMGGGAALSSSDLLSAIKQRKKAFASGQDRDSSGDEAPTPTVDAPQPSTEFDELLVELRNYIAFQANVDGQATTQEILEAFRDKVSLHQTAVFKSLLSRICDFSRKSNGDGIWTLKGEFR